MHEHDQSDPLANARLARRLAADCRDALAAEALLRLASEYEGWARALAREDTTELTRAA